MKIAIIGGAMARLGLAYELNGEYDSAVGEYSIAIKKSGGDYRPLFYMGNVYYKKMDFKLSFSRRCNKMACRNWLLRYNSKN